MTVAIAVTLVCDSRLRGRPGCNWRYDLGPDPSPAAVTARWRHATELGWTKQRGPDGTALHLCPACAGARLAGSDVGPVPPAEEEESIPRSIGEAAERARRREAAAGR